MEEEGKEWVYKYRQDSIGVGDKWLRIIYPFPVYPLTGSASAWRKATKVYSKDLLSW